MIINHHIEKCKAFKEQVMLLVKEGETTLDEENAEIFDLSSIKIKMKNSLEEG